MKILRLVVLAGFWIAGRAFAGTLTPPDQEFVIRFDAPFENNQAPASPLLDLGTVFTTEAWIWPEAGEAMNAEAIGRGDGGDLHHKLGVRFLDLRPYFVLGYDPSLSVELLSPDPIPLRGWTHLAATSNGSTVRFYVNAVEVATTLFPGSKTPNAAILTTFGRNYGGAIARVRVWSRALSAAEVETSANTPSPITGAPVGATGVIADWPMDDGFSRPESSSGTPIHALDSGPNQLDQVMTPGWIRRDVLENPLFDWERKQLELPGDAFRFALLDLDGDDDLDLVLLRHCPASDFLPVSPFCDGSPTPTAVFRFDEVGATFVADPDLLDPDDVQIVNDAADPVVADFTGDERPDVLATTMGTDGYFGLPSGDFERLLVQQPGGGLVDETVLRLPAAQTNGERAIAGDIDDDGDLDLYVENWGGIGMEACVGPFPPPGDAPCASFKVNDGSGHFTADFTRLPNSVLGPPADENPKHPALFDIDSDDDLDLLAMSWSGYGAPWMKLWLNDGAGHFSRAGPGWIPRKPGLAWHWAPALVAVDLDGNGTDELLGSMEATPGGVSPERFDLEPTPADERGQLVLWRRPGPGQPFADATASIDYPALSFGFPHVVDLNGDSRPDLLQHNARHHETFLATEEGGLQRAGRLFPSGHGAIAEAGDVDHDGDVDVVVMSPRSPFNGLDLFLNPGLALAPPAATASRPRNGGFQAAGLRASRSIRGEERSRPVRREIEPAPRASTRAALGDGPTAWVVSAWERALYSVDLGTDPPTLSGPYLAGELGAPGLYALDVEALPRDRRIAVSHEIFGNGQQALVDVGAPATPTVVENQPGNYSGDVAAAISPSGTFTVRSGQVVPIASPLATRANYRVLPGGAWPWAGDIFVTTSGVELTCVAIAPDGRTVLFCDRLGQRLIVGDFQFGGLKQPPTWNSESSLSTSGEPQNITIGPDGTVLVAIGVGDSGAVDVFKVTAPGVVVAGTPATIHGLPGNQQSIVFEPNGQKAWVLSTTPSPDKLSRLSITAPGTVSLNGAGIVSSPNDAVGAWLVGVDALAVDPDGKKLVVSSASISVFDTKVAVVDLPGLAVTVLDTGVVAPAGVAIVPGKNVFLDGFNAGNASNWSAAVGLVP